LKRKVFLDFLILIFSPPPFGCGITTYYKQNNLVSFLLIIWFLSNPKSLWSLIFFLYIFGLLVQTFLFFIFLIYFDIFLKYNVNIDSIKLINDFEMSVLKN
jgi:hypothetical protein